MFCDGAVAAVRVSADGDRLDNESSGETGLVVEGNAVACFIFS